MTTWKPTALEILQGMCVVTDDILPKSCDALFLHGPPFRDDELDISFLVYAAEQFQSRENRRAINWLVVNGLDKTVSRKINCAYIGHEMWERILMDQGVSQQNILRIPASAHTAKESLNLLELAKERARENVVIMGHRIHQLRCFLTIIKLMDVVGYHPNVYNLPMSGMPLTRRGKRLVIKGSTTAQGDIEDDSIGLAKTELERIALYAQPVNADGTGHRLQTATIPEMLDYVRKRS